MFLTGTINILFGARSSVDRALVSQTVGRGFESRRALFLDFYRQLKVFFLCETSPLLSFGS